MARLGCKAFHFGQPQLLPDKIGSKNHRRYFICSRRAGAPFDEMSSRSAGGLISSGRGVSLKGWVKPVVEPEIAIRIGHTLSGGIHLAAAANAIAALHPANALADADLPFEEPEVILNRNIFQRHAVLRPVELARQGSNTTGLTGILLGDGNEVARTGDPEAITGKLVEIICHIADLLGAFSVHSPPTTS